MYKSGLSRQFFFIDTCLKFFPNRRYRSMPIYVSLFHNTIAQPFFLSGYFEITFDGFGEKHSSEQHASEAREIFKLVSPKTWTKKSLSALVGENIASFIKCLFQGTTFRQSQEKF